MTESKVYEEMLLLRQCIQRKETCNRHCSDCKFQIDQKDADEALCKVVDILKSRNPELYFFDDFERLAKLTESISK